MQPRIKVQCPLPHDAALTPQMGATRKKGNRQSIIVSAMPKNRSIKSFMESFERHRSVTDPIASDTWTVKDGKGRKRTIRVEIGKPEPVPDDPNGDWFCAVFIEGFTRHVIPAMGVGPIDSLMNAVTLVRSFVEQVGLLQTASGSSKGATR